MTEEHAPYLDEGTVELVTPAGTYTLRPTLQALLAVCRRYGDFRTAAERVAFMDFDAIVHVVVVGANLQGQAAEAAPDALYRAGLVNVTKPVARYLTLLASGGREAAGDGTDQGNR